MAGRTSGIRGMHGLRLLWHPVEARRLLGVVVIVEVVMELKRHLLLHLLLIIIQLRRRRL